MSLNVISMKLGIAVHTHSSSKETNENMKTASSLILIEIALLVRLMIYKYRIGHRIRLKIPLFKGELSPNFTFLR